MTVNIEPMNRDFVAAAFRMADEFVLLSDYKEVHRDARGNVSPCDRCKKPIEKGQQRHEGQRVYCQNC